MRERPSLVARDGLTSTTTTTTTTTRGQNGHGGGKKNPTSGKATDATASTTTAAVDSSVKAKSIAAYLDLTLYAPPQHVQILNVTLAFQANPMMMTAGGGGGGGGGGAMASSARTKKELSPDEYVLRLLLRLRLMC